MQISQEDHLRWLKDPVTEEVFKIIRERRDTLAHFVTNGACMGSAGSSPEYYGECVGRYHEMTDLLEMTYEDMKEKSDVSG